MTMNRRIGTTTIRHLLDDPRLGRVALEGRTYFAAIDTVAVLTESTDAATAQAEWELLKHEEPALRARCARAELPGREGAQDVLPLGGVLRLVQVVDSPKAERLRGWLADAAAQAVEAAGDPELAVQRTRQVYESQGHSRRWVDGRVSAVSARREVAGEWYKRGVRESEEFRRLTNALLEAVFGMDATAMRASKNLTDTGGTLRDKMTDLELALLSLAESTAAALHRRRGSHGLDALLQDVAAAGRIAAQTRRAVVAATSDAPAVAA
jgi:prophage antirepressor-like protein